MDRVFKKRAGPMSETVLDLKGLKCPLPAMRTAKRLRAMETGQRLVVLATDPMAAIDIPHAVSQHGGSVEEMMREGEVLVFRILA